jgi:hypothetical protein
MLFLDDSGKPDVKHPSGAVVIGGFSIDSQLYPTLSRRVLGAKARFFPHRGQPQAWEIKSTAVVKPNPWKRSRNRGFCYELARLMATLGCTTYTATIVKSRMKHQMGLATTMPLQLQVLVEHFDAECRSSGATGIVVADWSSHQHDQHASRCVASFVASRRLALHPSVYYASSHGSEAIQVADLIAGVRRRVEEGDGALSQLDSAFRGVSSAGAGLVTVTGRAYSSAIQVF